jgi:hypothetical protein
MQASSFSPCSLAIVCSLALMAASMEETGKAEEIRRRRPSIKPGSELAAAASESPHDKMLQSKSRAEKKIEWAKVYDAVIDVDANSSPDKPRRPGLGIKIAGRACGGEVTRCREAEFCATQISRSPKLAPVTRSSWRARLAG